MGNCVALNISYLDIKNDANGRRSKIKSITEQSPPEENEGVEVVASPMSESSMSESSPQSPCGSVSIKHFGRDGENPIAHLCSRLLDVNECANIISLVEKAALDQGGFGHYVSYGMIIANIYNYLSKSLPSHSPHVQTYAKQTLRCRDHDCLYDSVRTVTDAMIKIAEDIFKEKLEFTSSSEPHIVKYDLSSRAKSRLETHTDNSDITMICTLSTTKSYRGGGTFFEALKRNIKSEQGEVLFFEGKHRHRGMKITKGERYLLVGFLNHKKK